MTSYLVWQAPPVDQYRKRIGRQDSKKEKRHLKEVKQRHEAKENRFTAYKDAVNQSPSYPLKTGTVKVCPPVHNYEHEAGSYGDGFT